MVAVSASNACHFWMLHVGMLTSFCDHQHDKTLRAQQQMDMCCTQKEHPLTYIHTLKTKNVVCVSLCMAVLSVCNTCHLLLRHVGVLPFFF